MMMMEMFLRRKKEFHRKWRPTDWRQCGSFDTYFVVVFPSLLLPSTPQLSFYVSHFLTALHPQSVFSLSPLERFSFFISLSLSLTHSLSQWSMFLSQLVFIFTEAIPHPVEYPSSNVFSFLLMQVFYVFHVVHRVDLGGGFVLKTFLMFTFAECWFKMVNVYTRLEECVLRRQFGL